MQPIVAAVTLPFLFTLGGVTVGVSTTPALPRPASPTAEAIAEGRAWPTNKVYPLLPLRMTDGSTWKVKMVRTSNDGTILVELRRANSPTTVSSVEVQAADVNTPIWWSTLVYVPNPEELPVEIIPGIPGENPEPVPTSPVPDPTPPPTIPPTEEPPTPPEGQ